MLTAGRRWPRLALPLVLAMTLAAAAGAGAQPPALAAPADQVRNAQAWVLGMLDVPAAWRFSRGSGVTVAVIDSGVYPGVSDLTGSVTVGPDLTGLKPKTPIFNPAWGQHGTWMGSLIAGHGHDGGADGVIGVAPASRILSIRVITDPGDPGYTRYQHEPTSRIQDELASAITDAVRAGAGVISMSIGYGGPSWAVRKALQYAYSMNVVVVASAGNSGRPGRQAPYSFPADYPGVISVAAVNSSDVPAGFSSDNLSVQVAAPGVDVPAQGRDGAYWLVSGTSPACALTAGVAALIRSADPGLRTSLVAQAITSTTTDRPPGGYDPSVGFGTVDAAAAVLAARRLAARQAAPGINGPAHFGGGAAGIPGPPVPRRGPGMLVVFALCAAAALLLLIAALRKMASARRLRPGHGPG